MMYKLLHFSLCLLKNLFHLRRKRRLASTTPIKSMKSNSSAIYSLKGERWQTTLSVNPYGTMTHIFCSFFDYVSLSLLLDHKIMFFAVENNHLNLVYEMIKRGNSPLSVDEDGNNLMVLAIKH